MVRDRWRCLYCGPLDSWLSSEAPRWSTQAEEQPSKVFPKDKQRGNNLQTVQLGEKTLKRGNRKRNKED